MKCLYCEGEMKRGYTTYHYDDNNIHVIIDKVEAWKCENCGEVVFEESDVESIQDFILVVKNGADKLHISA
ncbi:MAG: YgiT-type zinc finger protein [Spirochaetia bacterium]